MSQIRQSRPHYGIDKAVKASLWHRQDSQGHIMAQTRQSRPDFGSGPVDLDVGVEGAHVAREVRSHLRNVLAENRLPKVDVSVPASTTFAIVSAISGTKIALLGFKCLTVSQT